MDERRRAARIHDPAFRTPCEPCRRVPSRLRSTAGSQKDSSPPANGRHGWPWYSPSTQASHMTDAIKAAEKWRSKRLRYRPTYSDTAPGVVMENGEPGCGGQGYRHRHRWRSRPTFQHGVGKLTRKDRRGNADGYKPTLGCSKRDRGWNDRSDRRFAEAVNTSADKAVGPRTPQLVRTHADQGSGPFPTPGIQGERNRPSQQDK